MKLKAVALACTLGVISTGFAATSHSHATAKGKSGFIPGCEVTIKNYSTTYYADVYATFDDSGTDRFVINPYPYDIPHTINMYYDGYCHAGIPYLEIHARYGVYDYIVYSGYAQTNGPAIVINSIGNKVKAVKE